MACRAQAPDPGWRRGTETGAGTRDPAPGCSLKSRVSVFQLPVVPSIRSHPKTQRLRTKNSRLLFFTILRVPPGALLLSTAPLGSRGCWKRQTASLTWLQSALTGAMSSAGLLAGVLVPCAARSGGCLDCLTRWQPGSQKPEVGVAPGVAPGFGCTLSSQLASGAGLEPHLLTWVQVRAAGAGGGQQGRPC